MTSTRQVNPWAALSALCIGFFLIMMDTTIVNVAIPDMIGDLHADLNQITWVNSVYLLTYAVPLLIAGRLGDRLGRKPVFLTGMAVFTAASLLCGIAGGVGTLIVARAVQGLGAAIMAPQTMAFIGVLFPADRRGAALGAWGAVAGAATTAGPLLGGLLVGFGWHWVFLLNVPIGLVGLVLAVRLVPGGQERHQRRFDLFGTLLSATGLLALVFGLQSGEQYHWGRVIGPVNIAEILAVGVLLLIAFALRQRTTSREPLMPFALFAKRNFGAATAAAAAVCFALTAFYLPLTLFLQSVRDYTAWQAGILMVPIAVGAGVMGPFAGRLSDRISGKWVVFTGFGVFAVGIAVIVAVVGPQANSIALGAALLVCGIGTGIAFAPMANVATSEQPPELMGAASGVYNLIRQVGSVVGSALVSVLLQAELAGAATSADREGLAHAVRIAFLAPILALLLGCLACLAMTSRRRNAKGNTRIPARDVSRRVRVQRASNLTRMVETQWKPLR